VPEAVLEARGNRADPEGHELVKKILLDSLHGPADAPAALNAIRFFELQDKPEAESAIRQNPGAEAELGRLYVLAILGIVAFDEAKPVFDSADASSDFAHQARAALESCSEPAAEVALMTLWQYQGDRAKEWKDLAEVLLTRAPSLRFPPPGK
jgi:hypothetical protein